MVRSVLASDAPTLTPVCSVHRLRRRVGKHRFRLVLAAADVSLRQPHTDVAPALEHGAGAAVGRELQQRPTGTACIQTDTRDADAHTYMATYPETAIE